MKAVRRVQPLARRDRAAHKGDFGTVLVVAGSHGMLGAAILCATAALRGGAGLVRVALPSPLQPLLPLAVPCATTVLRDADSLARELSAVDATIAGPGLGATPTTRRLVQRLLQKTSGPLVLDADALNVLAPLGTRAFARAPLLLTPHPGEAGRLLGVAATDVNRDRPGAIAELCRRSGAVVVLKGARTLVADGERIFTNTTGNPGLATGGSGDVLGGLLAALLAQGVPPFEAACLAVHVHGRAADRVAARVGEVGLIASDLPLAIAEELA